MRVWSRLKPLEGFDLFSSICSCHRKCIDPLFPTRLLRLALHPRLRCFRSSLQSEVCVLEAVRAARRRFSCCSEAFHRIPGSGGRSRVGGSGSQSVPWPLWVKVHRHQRCVMTLQRNAASVFAARRAPRSGAKVVGKLPDHRRSVDQDPQEIL
ncbi:uncharacterized protein V6R79_002198 [Siganus canaliculatus]